MQFRSSTPDLHNFYNSFLQKKQGTQCYVSLILYTLHCTPYTENKKYFWYFLCFFLYLPLGLLSVFIYHPHARVRTLSIYTRSLHAVRHLNSRQAIHGAYVYTRVARHIPKLTLIAAITHRQEGQEKE